LGGGASTSKKHRAQNEDEEHEIFDPQSQASLSASKQVRGERGPLYCKERNRSFEEGKTKNSPENEHYANRKTRGPLDRTYNWENCLSWKDAEKPTSPLGERRRDRYKKFQALKGKIFRFVRTGTTILLLGSRKKGGGRVANQVDKGRECLRRKGEIASQHLPSAAMDSGRCREKRGVRKPLLRQKKILQKEVVIVRDENIFFESKKALVQIQGKKKRKGGEASVQPPLRREGSGRKGKESRRCLCSNKAPNTERGIGL